MAQNDEAGSNGEQKTPRGSKAIEVASGGLSTMQDLANFSIAHSIDVLQGTIGPKDANSSLRGLSVGIRAIEAGQRVGQHKEVVKIKADA